MTNAEALGPWGWNEAVAAACVELGPGRPGRVVRVDRGEVDVAVGPLAGDVARMTMTTAAKDCVAGDWVVADIAQARVDGVAPRVTGFVRRAARGARTAQTLAANMDVVLVVQALEPGLNPRRLERELVLAHQSGAEVAVVLTKTDLAHEADVRAATREAASVAPGCRVLAVSNRAGDGLGELAGVVVPGRTFALLGSSGVGKSSLVNALAGEEIQLEGEIREGDGKGRHTTTAARLVRLADGRLLLDTPGVRALALWESWEGLADTFPEIEELAERCRFADCFHTDEPGCAVIAATEEGDLDPARLDNWRRLREEMEDLDTHLVERERRESRTGRPGPPPR